MGASWSAATRSAPASPIKACRRPPALPPTLPQPPASPSTPTPTVSGPMYRTMRSPAPAVHRDAIESDNWPITWGDDDAQYTSYGDGWGFDPRTETKLGMGFARIIGPPAGLRGENIRSESERTGDGRNSPKASGILMV